MENEFYFLVRGPKNYEGAFRRTIEEFSEFGIQPVEEEVVADIARREEEVRADRAWVQEKEELGKLVESVYQGVFNEDRVVLSNFVNFYNHSKRTRVDYERIYLKSLSIEEFILGTVRQFTRSVENYKDVEKSPRFFNSKNGRKVLMYKPNGEALNARQIRLIVGKYGLDGQSPKPFDELMLQEETGRGTVSSADHELISLIHHSLRPQKTRIQPQ